MIKLSIPHNYQSFEYMGDWIRDNMSNGTDNVCISEYQGNWNLWFFDEKAATEFALKWK